MFKIFKLDKDVIKFYYLIILDIKFFFVYLRMKNCRSIEIKLFDLL